MGHGGAAAVQQLAGRGGARQRMGGGRAVKTPGRAGAARLGARDGSSLRTCSSGRDWVWGMCGPV